jgi:hypothetical protein
MWVLLAQFTLGVVSDLVVWFVKANKGHIKFKASFSVSDRLPIGHPLRNEALRDFELKGYAVVFGMGCCFIYGVFIAYLGPEFATGICHSPCYLDRKAVPWYF